MRPQPDEYGPSPGVVRVIRRAGDVTAVLAAVVSAGIMLGIVVDVVNREITGRSVPGMLELVETFMVVVVFLGLAHAEATGTHVRMGLVTRVLPHLWRRMARAFAMVVCMLGSAWFCYVTALRALDATTAREVRPGLLRFPVWPARIIVAVGFGLLVLEYGVRVWEELRRPSEDRDASTDVGARLADEREG